MTLALPRRVTNGVRLDGLSTWLLATQLLFNIGFYLVMPFLALHLRGELGLSSWLVGLVVGARTFSQQGLFVVGGVVVDRLGARPTAIAGCLLRVVGFVVLGTATELAGVLVGAVLTGVAGALFSPAVESCLAHVLAEGCSDGEAAARRRTGFAAFAVAGEVGAMAGPLVGTLALGAGFRTACLAAAGVFAVITVAHARWLPRGARHPGQPLRTGFAVVGRNRAFLVFAAAHCTYLLAYNQLYFLVPDALAVSAPSDGQAAQALAVLMAVASATTIAAQLPWARLMARLPRHRVFSIGFGLMAAGAVTAGLGTWVADGSDDPGYWWAGPTGFVLLLTLGQMTVTPQAVVVTATMARDRHLGAHLGALASAGGIAALAGTPLLGGLSQVGGPALPWLGLAAACLFSACVLRRSLRDGHRSGRGTQCPHVRGRARQR